MIDKRSIGPNIITAGNLLLGFWALLLIGDGNYLGASWLIVVAAILDGLDGPLARLVKSDGSFGLEIDSLVDVVSFGVAPSVLVYHVFLERFGLAGLALAFLPLIAGAFRLARYNARMHENPDRKGFAGMPITCSALIIASFNIYIHANGGDASETVLWFSLIPAVTLIMISPIPYRKLPVINISNSKFHAVFFFIQLAAGAAVIWNPGKLLFIFMIIYFISGPVEWGLDQFRKARLSRNDHNIHAHRSFRSRSKGRSNYRDEL